MTYHGIPLDSYFDFRPLEEVEVWWWDITTELGWVDNDAGNQAMMPKPVKSRGYLMYEDEFRIIIAAACDHGQVADRTAIPRGCIHKLVRCGSP